MSSLGIRVLSGAQSVFLQKQDLSLYGTHGQFPFVQVSFLAQETVFGIIQLQSVFGAELVLTLKQDSVKKPSSMSNSTAVLRPINWLLERSGDQSWDTATLSKDTDVIHECDPCQSFDEACTRKLLLYK